MTTTQTFRTHPAEIVRCPKCGGVGEITTGSTCVHCNGSGRLVMTLCEELDEESGRWEPFYSMTELDRG